MNTNILFYAFRYCLGRSTYAVNDCVQELTKNWEVLNTNDKNLIHKEIKHAIETNRAGMDMDVKQWEKILELSV